MVKYLKLPTKRCPEMRKIPRSSERGFIILLVVAVLIVLIGICALALGIGKLTVTKSRLKIVSNLTALAALEQYTRSDASTYQTRTDDAMQKAQVIIQGNPVSGLKQLGALGINGAGESGEVTFGVWVLNKDFEVFDEGSPTPITYGPCPGNIYPCFMPLNNPAAGSNPTVTAVRVTLRPQPSNPFIIPFGKLFGTELVHPEVTSTASVIQRCTAFLIDLSPSIASEHHTPIRSTAPATGLQCLRDSDGNGNFYCFDDSSIPSNTTTILGHCQCGDTGDPLNANLEYPNCPPCSDPELTPWHASIQARIPQEGPHKPHPTPSPIPFPHHLPQVDRPGLFVYRASQVDGYPVWVNPPAPTPGFPLVNPSYPTSEMFYWANMPRKRPASEAGPPGFNPNWHYRSDYGDSEPSPFNQTDGSQENLYFDRLLIPGVYSGPQPFTRLMDGFNAGFRYLRAISSFVDLNLLMGFAGDPVGQPRGRIPDMPAFDEPQKGMSSDIGYFIQITNLMNRGMVDWAGNATGSPPVHPNFLDENLFPLFGGQLATSTNIPSAMNVAIEQMRNSCPARSKKQIIIATDGIMSCSLVNNSPVCNSTWTTYQNAENQLINGAAPDILGQLQDSDIAVTVILDGWYTSPNIYSMRNPEYLQLGHSGSNPCTDGTLSYVPPECFMSMEQAQQRGQQAFFDTKNYNLVNSLGTPFDPADPSTWQEEPNDETAFGQVSSNSIIFGHSLEVFQNLAFNSGGYLCPLLPEAPDIDNWYVDHDKDDNAPDELCDPTDIDATPCLMNKAVRPFPSSDSEFQVLRYSPTSQSRAAQAADCVIKAIGTNPFTLVEEER